MAAWRHVPVNCKPLAWCIRETHVATAEEASALQHDCRKLWGKHLDREQATLSCLSIESTKARGVAILLTPTEASVAALWNQDWWTSCVIVVKIDDMSILNVYAPTIRAEREKFFTSLHEGNMRTGDTILVGDFISVQSPQLNKLGPRKESHPESPSLQELVSATGLSDARHLRDHADDDELDTTHHYTYWTDETAIRIIRFYVPKDWTLEVLWVSTSPPSQNSDHDQVVLHFRGRQPDRPVTRRPRTTYPIQYNQPD